MKRDLRQEELIGKSVKVGNIEGTIIDETKNMVIVKQRNGKNKKVIKKSQRFNITFKGKNQIIEGKDIIYRPDERIRIKK